MRYQDIINEANYKSHFDLTIKYQTEDEFNKAIGNSSSNKLKASKPQAGGVVYLLDDAKGVVGCKIPNAESSSGYYWIPAKQPFWPAKKPAKVAPSVDAKVATTVAQKAEPKVVSKPPLPKNPKFEQTTSYSTTTEFMAAIKKRFGDVTIDYDRASLPSWYGSGDNSVFLYFNPDNNMPLGRWEVTSSRIVSGRGRVTTGTGHVALLDQSDSVAKAAVAKPAITATKKATDADLLNAIIAVRTAMKTEMNAGSRNRFSTAYTGDWQNVETLDDGYELTVRDWGVWETPIDAEDADDGDYDWQELSSSWSKKLGAIIERVSTSYPTVKLSWSTSEKNYLSITANSRI